LAKTDDQISDQAKKARRKKELLLK